jgi:hypothetical protein
MPCHKMGWFYAATEREPARNGRIQNRGAVTISAAIEVARIPYGYSSQGVCVWKVGGKLRIITGTEAYKSISMDHQRILDGTSQEIPL